MTVKKTISIVTPCFNESENIIELSSRIKSAMSSLPYKYEHIFIDNNSTDNTVNIIKEVIKKDKRVKLIVNVRNFGHIRSPYYAMLQSSGDATIVLASDLQDPPEMIHEFIKKWKIGYNVVLSVKPESEENFGIYYIRKLYYLFLRKISEVPIIKDATGAGLFDKKIINLFAQIQDPYPYVRGLVCELGYPIATVQFKQPRRARGISKNNFYTLYDIAMLGITNHSKLPLRIITISGFLISLLSISTAIFFLVMKLFFWNSFQLGIAPILIGIFFFGSIQAFAIGILGEYILTIHTRSRNFPHVIEKERINF